MASLTPASVINADKTKGSIEPDKDADILLLDDNLNIHSVYTGGRLI
jgi:N-acetylglucosamine-6-phosphate deacetylase